MRERVEIVEYKCEEVNPGSYLHHASKHVEKVKDEEEDEMDRSLRMEEHIKGKITLVLEPMVNRPHL